MQLVVWASRLHSCPPSHHSLKKNLPKTENKSQWGPAVSPLKRGQSPKPPPNSRHEITTRKDDFQTLNSSVSFSLHNCAIAMANRPPASVSIIHDVFRDGLLWSEISGEETVLDKTPDLHKESRPRPNPNFERSYWSSHWDWAPSFYLFIFKKLIARIR